MGNQLVAQYLLSGTYKNSERLRFLKSNLLLIHIYWLINTPFATNLPDYKMKLLISPITLGLLSLITAEKVELDNKESFANALNFFMENSDNEAEIPNFPVASAATEATIVAEPSNIIQPKLTKEQILSGQVCQDLDDLPDEDYYRSEFRELIPHHEIWRKYCFHLFNDDENKACSAFPSCTNFDVFREANLGSLCCKSCHQFAKEIQDTDKCSDESRYFMEFFNMGFDELARKYDNDEFDYDSPV